MTQSRSGIRIIHPSINAPELEETTCIKCGGSFLSEDRRRIRYCAKCRKIVNSKSHKLGIASEFVDYHKIFEHLEPRQKRRMRTNKRNPCDKLKRIDF